MSKRHSSRRDIEQVTRELQESGDKTAREGQDIADDAEQISEVHRSQYDAPTDEEESQIAELQERIRDRVESVLDDVEREKSRLESEMQSEASDRQESASEQQANAQEFRKFYGLNKEYDRGAVDQMIGITKEGVDFQLQQREQTERALAELNEELARASSRVRDAFSDLNR